MLVISFSLAKIGCIKFVYKWLNVRPFDVILAFRSYFLELFSAVEQGRKGLFDDNGIGF